MLSRRSPLPAGFTLVELMVVLVIIAILASLSMAGYMQIQRRATQARMVVEMGQLDNALKSYKERHDRYPPNFGDANVQARQQRFLRHLRAAFPRFARYRSYAELRNVILTTYNYKTSAGTLANLDIDRLDQAEALVFWLGGMPTPWDAQNTAAIAPRRLFGFHQDPTDPFKREARVQEQNDPLKFRTQLYYAFDEQRLVDNDEDGWWEYVPQLSASAGSHIPPYVYFDAEGYVQISPTNPVEHLGYPQATNVTVPPGHLTLYSEWGMAVPYAEYHDPNHSSPTKWINSGSFQIICCGMDGLFSTPGASPARMRLSVFPNGATWYSDNQFGGDAGYYDSEERDNLTSFTSADIGNATEESAAK